MSPTRQSQRNRSGLSVPLPTLRLAILDTESCGQCWTVLETSTTERYRRQIGSMACEVWRASWYTYTILRVLPDGNAWEYTR